MSDERSRWDSVADEMSERLGGRRVEFGRHVSYWFENSPRRALYSMSYYKFAAKLIGGAKRVLDVGCGEGLGTWLLAKECGYARGVDLDEDAIGVAQRNWDDERIDFDCVDFLAEDPGTWDAITNFDVIEHILPEHAPPFLSRIAAALAH
ncbi:MAG TPA: class I SAM-dependent methyltransferase, partial [Solirubrobacteraceae bacterium]